MKFLLTIIIVFFLFAQSSGQNWKELNDSLGYYFYKSDFINGAAMGEKVIDAARKEFGPTDSNYLFTLNNVAILYRLMGKFEKAVSLSTESLAACKIVFGPNHPNTAVILSALASAHRAMGNYKKAEPLIIEAKSILKNALGTEDPAYGQILNSLALLYKMMEEFEKAEPLYIESLEISKKAVGGSQQNYAVNLNNLAAFYYNLGQYEKAEPLFTKSTEILKKVKGVMHPDYAAALNNLGIVFQDLGQYEKAKSLYVESMEIRKKALGPTHPDYAASLINLGNLDENMGQYEPAESLYLESLEITKKTPGPAHPDYAIALNNLAGLYRTRGSYEKAIPLYIESLNIFKNTLGTANSKYARILNNQALLYESMQDYKKAEELIAEANAIQTDNLINTFTILSEKEKGNYLANNITMLQTSNSHVFNYKKASAAILQNNFNQQLFLKSLTLTDTKTLLELVRNSPDTNTQKVFENWEQKKKLLANQYSLPLNNRRTDIQQIEADAENLEKELGRKSTAFRQQQNEIRISIKDVQKNLEQNEVAVEFVSFKLYNKKWTDSTIYAAYLVNKKDSIPYFVPLFEETQLQQLIDSSGKTINKTAQIFYRGVALKDKNTKQGEALYKLVWQPLEPYLKGIKKISYSPAGKLFGIAFHALPINNDSLLMEKYQLRQYTSTRQVALRNTDNQNRKPTDIVLFGDPDFSMDSVQLTKQHAQQTNSYVSRSIYAPSLRGITNNLWPGLPGTAEEIKSIGKLFDINKIGNKSFAQTAASEENLKALSGQSPQVLHIATHGFFLADPVKQKQDKSSDRGNIYTLASDPLLRTGLILAGGNYAWGSKTPIEGVEDGIATAYEISQLNLSNTELVVLSACETALGDIKGSEGVFGLQRAFKMAGVKKMIVSLWKVPDKETAELMTAFYLYWINGKTINDAFAQAQADMRKKYAPFYWAAFVLVE